MRTSFVIVLALLALCTVVQSQYWGVPQINPPPLGQDLADMDFRNMIGTPLTAVVTALTLAAQTTVDFINNIGFTQSRNAETGSPLGGGNVREVLMITFNYNQSINGTKQVRSMSLPFLFIVPIPFLQFDLTTLDLLVQLNSVTEAENNYASEYEGTYTHSWGSSCTYKSSYAQQYSNENSASITEQFHLAVHVQASQSPLPEGMSMLLQLFDTIIETGAAPVTHT